jgi:uncharacterized alpha-E superfamily protein
VIFRSTAQYHLCFKSHYFEATNTSSVKCLISKARENARGSQDKITKELWDILTLCIILLMTQSCLKLATSEAMTVLGKINKDFLLYNGIYQVTMPRGLVGLFKNWKTY